MLSAKIWVLLAGLSGAMGVALGAYHAHGLERSLERRGLDASEIDERMRNCEIGVRYQMYHALALLGVGLLTLQRRSTLVQAVGWLFLFGQFGFSGGLYAMSLTTLHLHWAIVPSGGLMLIIGWLALAASAFRLPASAQ